ncbi:hypothetical protein FY192_00700 [Anaplasma marginale]|nr:hypothetical protein FY192_00700 [Anaplasma marginale]
MLLPPPLWILLPLLLLPPPLWILLPLQPPPLPLLPQQQLFQVFYPKISRPVQPAALVEGRSMPTSPQLRCIQALHRKLLLDLHLQMPK